MSVRGPEWTVAAGASIWAHKKVKRVFAFSISFVCVVALWFGISRWFLNQYSPQVKFNPAGWRAPLPVVGLSGRQMMMRDLILNVLPGKNRVEVEELLGRSPSKAEMRRLLPSDLLVTNRVDQGKSGTFPRREDGYYYDEFDWDLIYGIGAEQSLSRKYLPVEPEYRSEKLIIRFDTNGVFKSWYVFGSSLWPQIVGREGRGSYRDRRE